LNGLVARVLRSRLHRLLGGRLLLLTYRGRRSGRPHTLPLLYARDGDDLLLVALHPRTQTWWRNVRGRDVTLLVRGVECRGRAELVADADAARRAFERAHAWARPALRRARGAAFVRVSAVLGSGSVRGVSELHGSCLCGAVRFEVSEPFALVSACHCTSCKKLSGSWGTVSGRARSAAVRVVAGEASVTRYQPPEGRAKAFCSECGSNLFGGGWPDSEWCSVRLAALDVPFDRRPDRHIFVRSVAAWETLPDDGAERYETSAG